MAAGTLHRSLEVTGLIEEQERIERLLITNPVFEKKLQRVVDKALRAVRAGVVKDAKSVISNDTREAYRSVRRTVYMRILGGQVNILNKRRAGKLKEPDQYSNANQHWRRRGYKTGQMMRYQKSDRGFALRFINQGTQERVSKTMDAHPMYRKSIVERPKHRHYVSNTLGYRGREGNVAARNFFSESKQHMEDEVPTLEQMITRLIEEEFND